MSEVTDIGRLLSQMQCISFFTTGEGNGRMGQREERRWVVGVRGAEESERGRERERSLAYLLSCRAVLFIMAKWPSLIF